VKIADADSMGSNYVHKQKKTKRSKVDARIKMEQATLDWEINAYNARCAVKVRYVLSGFGVKKCFLKQSLQVPRNIWQNANWTQLASSRRTLALRIARSECSG
jgi:hypothetical protein